MSESLRKLVKIGSFNILQDKLEEWLENYHYNTCDQNVARGCEIVELNAKIQGQLFKLLNVCASEGGVYGGAGVLKTRLLPLLEKGFFSSGMGTDGGRSALSELNYGVDKTSREVKRIYEKSLDDLDYQLKRTKHEYDSLKIELQETKQELERQGRQSSSDKMFDHKEICDLKNELESVRFENDRLKVKADATVSYEREIEHLKDDVAVLRSCRSPSPCHSDCYHGHYHSHHDHLHNSHHHHHSHHGHHHHHSTDCCCPLECALHNCTIKEQSLVAKMNDLFSISRVDAMNTLGRFSEDHDNNQKIVFHSVTESFNAAKSAFRSYKSRVRTDMIGRHTGVMTLEESVQHHIDNHGEHEADFTSLNRDVIRALDFKVPIIRRPGGMGFDLISSFIREACKVAWNMSCLPTPIDVYHPTTEGELYDEKRYRRSYDSDYSAPFISHHVWPCLVKNGIVIAKGEGVTHRAGSVSKSPRTSRSPGRSHNLTSGRSISPISKRSKSPVNMMYRSKSPTLRRSRKF